MVPEKKSRVLLVVFNILHVTMVKQNNTSANARWLEFHDIQIIIFKRNVDLFEGLFKQKTVIF
jgi:hypothetical protein